MRLHLFLALPILGLALPTLANQPLQAWLDTALPGTTLRLPPGKYRGPAIINKIGRAHV